MVALNAEVAPRSRVGGEPRRFAGLLSRSRVIDVPPCSFGGVDEHEPERSTRRIGTTRDGIRMECYLRSMSFPVEETLGPENR